LEKQKPGFGRAFVVSGSCVSWLPASGRHYPWFRMSGGWGSEPFPAGKDPTPVSLFGVVTKLKSKKPDLSIWLFAF